MYNIFTIPWEETQFYNSPLKTKKKKIIPLLNEPVNFSKI